MGNCGNELNANDLTSIVIGVIIARHIAWRNWKGFPHSASQALNSVSFSQLKQKEI